MTEVDQKGERVKNKFIVLKNVSGLVDLAPAEIEQVA
jgi:hypothetical protein